VGGRNSRASLLVNVLLMPANAQSLISFGREFVEIALFGSVPVGDRLLV
jgi:hypothetical protein